MHLGAYAYTVYARVRIRVYAIVEYRVAAEYTYEYTHYNTTRIPICVQVLVYGGSGYLPTAYTGGTSVEAEPGGESMCKMPNYGTHF